MKLIALGDTHGRRNWATIVSNNMDADKIVFIGDYFDTHENVRASQQMENFKDIIEFKKQNMDKVVLLFGNHDYHYLPHSLQAGEYYSGFQSANAFDIKELLVDALNQNLMQICLVLGNMVFTHAGVTKTWCINNDVDVNNLEQSINDLFKYKPSCFKFTPGRAHNPYGDEECQTPIWVRPHSLLKDGLNGFVQVVGHTTQDKINQTAGRIVKIDTLGTSGEYLKYEDGKITPAIL